MNHLPGSADPISSKSNSTARSNSARYRVALLVDNPPRLVARDDQLQEMPGGAQQGGVPVQEVADARFDDLEDHLLARWQAGPVALGDRRRAERLRIDLGEHGIEVWEINTNPTLVNDMYESLPRHWEAFFPVVKRVARALAGLVDEGEGRPAIPSAALREIRPRFWRRLKRSE